MNDIQRQDLKAMIDNNASFTLVEVLPEGQYRKKHLPEAKNVPLNDDFQEEIRQIVTDRNEKVILYCKSTECPMADRGASIMEDMGYENVNVFSGGKDAWEDAGYEMEEG